MQDEDTATTEYSTNDGIGSMINHAANNDFVAANKLFQNIVNDKISDSLDQEKIRIAAQVFATHENEEELDDEDFDDEDAPDLDELLSDEE